jgi:hypothetical protein
MRTNSLRLKLLIARLEATGYVFPCDENSTNVVSMDDYRNDD